MKTLAKFDFGNDGVTADAGFTKIERLYITSRYIWVNELRNRWLSEENPSPYKDIVYAKTGEFRMGLPAGSYTFTLQFYDTKEAHAPFDVYFARVGAHDAILSGERLLSVRVEPAIGQILEKEVAVPFSGGILAVQFPAPFFISGMTVQGDGAFLPMYPEAPADSLPSLAEVMKNGKADAAAMLRLVCEFILENKTADGFVGDFEAGKRLWYTSSYPMRTLLAGYDLFGETRYLGAATDILDRFVAEQMPEGAFTQAYRGKPTATLSAEELDEVRRGNWMNLADIGSMVAALTVACRYADPERNRLYLAAVKKYLDKWALTYRQPSGGFTNGWVCHPAEKVYSVSTASSALTMALYYQLTGEETYLRAAEDAVLFLAEGWGDDGRGIHYIYDGTYPGHDYYQSTREFGDGFYPCEAFSALLAISQNETVRQTLFLTLEKYLFGDKGILSLREGLPWWPLQNNWHNSKSAANPIFLLDYLRYGARFGTDGARMRRAEEVLSVCLKFLCTPAYAKQIGVLLKTPEGTYPFKNHSIQSFAGCAVAATGFCGIALANLLRENMIYLQ